MSSQKSIKTEPKGCGKIVKTRNGLCYYCGDDKLLFYIDLTLYRKNKKKFLREFSINEGDYENLKKKILELSKYSKEEEQTEKELEELKHSENKKLLEELKEFSPSIKWGDTVIIPTRLAYELSMRKDGENYSINEIAINKRYITCDKEKLRKIIDKINELAELIE